MSYGGSVVERARYKYPAYGSFAAAIFVAVVPFDCDPGCLLPSDLLTMGDVATVEYECLTHFRERFSRLPAFNDKEMSPKYSLAIGRPDMKDLTPATQRTLKLTSERLNCCGFAATRM
jgi:hypothetical protein